jgi:hypothetical protein
VDEVECERGQGHPHARVDTYLPKTCVDGIVQKYAVKVRLGRVASGPSIDVFSGMTLTIPGARGPASAETSTYTLDDRSDGG